MIPEVLKHISEQHLLQPLMVVKLLAENKCATLSDIEPYIVQHLEEQNEAIVKVGCGEGKGGGGGGRSWKKAKEGEREGD